jgi:hypothetical protein
MNKLNQERPKTRQALPPRNRGGSGGNGFTALDEAFGKATHRDSGATVQSGLAVTSRLTIGAFTLLIMPVVTHGEVMRQDGGVDGIRSRSEALRAIPRASSYERVSANDLWPKLHGKFGDNQHEGFAGAAVVSIDPTQITGVATTETLVIAISPMGVEVYAYPLLRFTGKGNNDHPSKYVAPVFNAGRRINKPLFTILGDETGQLIGPWMDGNAMVMHGFDGSTGAQTAAKMTAAFLAMELTKLRKEAPEGLISEAFVENAVKFLTNGMLASAGVGTAKDITATGCSFDPAIPSLCIPGSVSVASFVTRLGVGAAAEVHTPVINKLSEALAEARAAEVQAAALRMSGGIVAKVLQFLDDQGVFSVDFKDIARLVNGEFQFEQAVGGEEAEEVGEQAESVVGEQSESDDKHAQEPEINTEATDVVVLLDALRTPATYMLPGLQPRADRLWENCGVVFGDENGVMSDEARGLVEQQYANVAEAAVKTPCGLEAAVIGSFNLLEAWVQAELEAHDGPIDETTATSREVAETATA